MATPRATAARLDALVQQAREPVFWLGPDRRFVMVNRAWEELTGHDAGSVIGVECQPHGPTRPGDLAGLGGSFCPPPEALAGQPAGSNTLILHAKGERRWRRVEFWPFHDTSGTLIGLLGLVRLAESPAQAPDSASQRLRAELMEVRDRLLARYGSDTLIGRGPEHRRLLDQVAAASSTAVPVLIVGEPGTGKLLVARTIHLRGPRRQSPLLAYDCQALPPEVIERELFGGPNGPAGRGFRAPEGSTLVIREVAELVRDLQARLAAGLDGKARLIATTTADPEAALRSDRLRPDLYYAITTLVIRLRPLRERLDELPLFAQHFLERSNLREESRRDGFSPPALGALAAYDWPGNLRELAKVVDEAHGRGHSRMIQLDDIPPEIRGHRGGAYEPPTTPTGPTPLRETLLHVERRLIERALERAGRNKSRAAKTLGVNRPFLYRRIKELGIADEPESSDEPTNPI